MKHFLTIYFYCIFSRLNIIIIEKPNIRIYIWFFNGFQWVFWVNTQKDHNYIIVFHKLPQKKIMLLLISQPRRVLIYEASAGFRN